MKIAIAGAGAMGSIYAAHFAEAGHEVWAIDLWAAHVSAMNAGGLHIEGPAADRVVSGIHATMSLEDAGACDLYVIATKGDGVADVASRIAPAMRDDSMVLTIQNGLGAGVRIAAHMPTANVLLGVADGFGASMVGPAHVKHRAMNLIRLGEMNGGSTKRLQELASVWQQAGFNARAFDDIHQLIWEKFICNVALSAPCALFDCSIGELLANEESRAVSIGCLMEAYELGKLEGINFSFDDPVNYLEQFVSNMPSAMPSLHQDVMAQRRSEIDAINGQVPLVAKKHAMATPYNQTLTALVRAREARYAN